MDNDLLNFQSNQLGFDDIEEENIKVHIRVQQRNGRKSWTLVEGIDDIYKAEQGNNGFDKFMKRIIKEFRKEFHCSVSLQKDKDNDDKCIIQMQGDKREEVKEYLIKSGLVDKDNIIMHGF